MRKLAIVLAILGMMLGIGFTAIPAHATGGTSWCNNASPPSAVTCLNAWYGGPLVKSFAPGVANDNFNYYQDTGACNAGLTSTNCPISGVPSNLEIIKVTFQGSGVYQGDCVGDYLNSQTNAAAGLGSCSNWGTTIVVDTTSCASGTYFLVDAHFSTNWSSRVGIGWQGDGNGQQIYLDEGVCLQLVYM